MNTFLRTARSVCCWAGLGAVLNMAWATCPTWPTTERFILNGSEVTDRRTGLVWARCSVGQTWDGSTCSGAASTFTHEAAFTHAASQSGWRLPNRRELFLLADRGCYAPAIDATAFPNTPATANDWFWTSSPYTPASADAWIVSFEYGALYDSVNRANPSALTLYRNRPNYIRLVRRNAG